MDRREGGAPRRTLTEVWMERQCCRLHGISNSRTDRTEAVVIDETERTEQKKQTTWIQNEEKSKNKREYKRRNRGTSTSNK